MTAYMHMQAPLTVRTGQTVTMGTQLGVVGSTGDSSGPHLHYEQWSDGRKVESYFDGVASGITDDARANSVTRVSRNCGRSPDVTRDGKADILARDADGDLLLYRNSASIDGIRTFRAPIKASHGWGGMRHIRTGDVNRDGFTDVVAISAAGDLMYYRNTGVIEPGRILSAGRVINERWGGITALAVGDVSGDGRADVVARAANGDLLFYGNNGNDGFYSGVPVSHGWNGMRDILLGDVTGDGKADVIARNGEGLLYFYGNNGHNGFYAGRQVSHGWGGMDTIVLGDVSGDGKADIVARDGDDNLQYYGTSGVMEPGRAFYTPIRVGERWGGITAITL